MADVALPASLASLLSPAPADSAALTATAQPTDPFAALFAAVAGVPAATAAAAAAAAATATAATASSEPVQALPVATPAILATAPVIAAHILPAATPTILTTPATAPAIAAEALPIAREAAPSVTEKTGDDDKRDAGATSEEDPLAAAIASGANAVLAFVPTIAPIPQAPAPAPIPVSVPVLTSASVPAPVSTPTLTQAPTQVPIAIDAPMVVPRKLPAIGSPAPAPRPFKAIPQPINVETAAPDAGKAMPDPDSPTPQPPQAPTVAADGKPVATPLSPETLKTVIAAIEQGDQAPVPVDPVATPAPATNIQAKVTAQLQQPLPQAAEQQAAAHGPAPVRRSGDDVAPPRRAGSDSRKRIEPAAIDNVAAPLAQRAADGAHPVDPSTTVVGKGDTIVEQTLSIARDGAWLDTLARDIANSAGTGTDLQFKLNPQNLGSLTVAIAQSADGASIRLTADTDTTRNILLDAQPKLIAEARAQGLKISDTHVDLSNQHQAPNQDASRWTQGNAGQNGGAQNGQNRQSSPAYQPFVSNLGRKSDAESESPPGDSDALYA